MKQIEGQLEIWDILQQSAPEDEVSIKGIVNMHTHPISDYDVSLNYNDLVLLVAMCEDYVRGLDKILESNILWETYYRGKFKGISDKIQKQIEYDYEKAREKCTKNKKTDDVGEDALALVIKRG